MAEISIVTLTTEYGNNSPYTAAIQGGLLAVNSRIQTLVVSNEVIPGDILAASYHLRMVLAHFPKDALHLVAVDLNLVRHKQLLVARCKDQFVVAADNGLFSVLFDGLEAEVFAFPLEGSEISAVFPEPDVFVRVMKQIMEPDWKDHLKPAVEPVVLKRLSPAVEGNQLKGSIIFIDGYENIVTDIRRSDFESMQQRWKSFTILYRRRSGIKRLSSDYDDEKNGELIALFNSLGYLEIAIRNGNAKSLLGLQPGGNIIVEFND